MKIIKEMKILLLTLSMSVLFLGCATTELQTQAKMTQSVFLNPVKKSERIIYVDIKNTSGEEIDTLIPLVERKLQSKGYKLTDDPEMAKYILQANVLFANDKKENNAAGGAVVGGAVGGAVGGHNSDSTGTTVAVGAAGAVLGGLLAKWTEDTVFQMVVDVNIREKTDKEVYTTKGNVNGNISIDDKKRAGFMNTFGGKVRSTKGGGELNDNSESATEQYYATNYIESRTRVFAEATQKDLNKEQAIPILEKKIASQISGIF